MRNIALALGLISLVTAAHAAPPLLQEGKKTLYQRVLTTPGCALHEAPGGKPGAVQPTFSRFYVYAGKDEAGKSWVQVGPDSLARRWVGSTGRARWTGGCRCPWRSPIRRARSHAVFKDRSALDAVFNAIDPVEKIAPVRQQLKTKGQAPGIVAQEPELFVDMAKNFYLLPILGGEEVMTEQNMRVRVLNVASVSAADAVDSAKAGQDQSTAHERTKQIKEFSSAVVFVIDSTISMDPYIERTREAVRKIYAKVEAEKLGDKVKFGLVAFRSSTKAVPALEYVSKIYADPNKVKDGADFMAKVAELKQAKVSSSAFDEDAYAGVMDAVNSIDWRPYGARYVVLITDAGAIEGATSFLPLA